MTDAEIIEKMLETIKALYAIHRSADACVEGNLALMHAEQALGQMRRRVHNKSKRAEGTHEV